MISNLCKKKWMENSQITKNKIFHAALISRLNDIIRFDCGIYRLEMHIWFEHDHFLYIDTLKTITGFNITMTASLNENHDVDFKTQRIICVRTLKNRIQKGREMKQQSSFEIDIDFRYLPSFSAIKSHEAPHTQQKWW